MNCNEDCIQHSFPFLFFDSPMNAEPLPPFQTSQLTDSQHDQLHIMRVRRTGRQPTSGLAKGIVLQHAQPITQEPRARVHKECAFRYLTYSVGVYIKVFPPSFPNWWVTTHALECDQRL